MIQCVCGEAVPDHVTMHWTNTGRHRVDGSDIERPSAAPPVANAPDTRSEKEVQAAIVEALRVAGYSVWDTSQPFAAKITPGLPDLLVMGRGRMAFVEVKREGGELTEAQRSFALHCAETGTEHRVWRSEAEAIEWMEAR